MTTGPRNSNSSPESGRRTMPIEIVASGKTAERRPSAIGFREGNNSDDTVSDMSDGNEWLYDTNDAAVPSTIMEYRSRANARKKKEAAARLKRGSSAAVPGAEWVDGHQSRKSSSSSSPLHQLAALKASVRSEAEPSSIDDVLAENIQLKEINQSVWREMHALRKRRQKETEDAETSRRKIQSAAGSIESLQEQLATSMSLVESMERDKEANESIIEDLQKLVTGLTDELAATADELKAAKKENRRKSRQVATLESSLKTSGRDLERTRKSLKDKIRKTICMEVEIETLKEELNGERASHANTSSLNNAPAEADPLHDSDPSFPHGQSTATMQLDRSVGSFSELEDKLSTILEEQETMKKTHANEKIEMEERHQSQLRKVQEAAEAEKDQLLREVNSLEQMLINQKNDKGSATDKTHTETSRRMSHPARASGSSTSLKTHLIRSSGTSYSDRRHHRASGAKGSHSSSMKTSKSSRSSNPYLHFPKGISKIISGNMERQESPIQTPELSGTHTIKSSKSAPSRNPQQDSNSSVASLRGISEMVREKALSN